MNFNILFGRQKTLFEESNFAKTIDQTFQNSILPFCIFLQFFLYDNDY